MFLFTFLAVLAFTVILFIRKSGYHVDEIYTYGLSNSHFAPGINDLVGGGRIKDVLITRQDLTGYLTVAPNQRFDYASVFYNQSMDVHPPLHYCVINTVCSLFPGVFSKWIGLSVNLVFWAVTLLLVYKSALLLKSGRRISAVAVAVYGLSQIALSSVLMIRMYTMSTMLTALLVYLLLKLEKAEKNYLYVFVILGVYLGALTHYNFIIFAFFLTASYDLYLLLNKKYPQLVKFSVAALVGIVLMFLSFPSVLDQFAANKLVSGGTALTQLLTPKMWLGKLGFYIVDSVSGIPLLFLLLAEAAMILIPAEKKKKTLARSFNSVTFVLIVSAALAFVCISITSPAHTSRYVCHLFPVAAVVLARVLQKAAGSVNDERLLKYRNAIKRFCIPAALVFGIVMTGFISTPGVLYLQHKGLAEKAAQYGDCPCVFFCREDLNCITGNTPQLIKYNDFFVTDDTGSEKLKEYISEQSADTIVVYVEEVALTGKTSFAPEELLGEFKAAFPEYQSAQPLYVRGYGGAGTYSAYVLSKG